MLAVRGLVLEGGSGDNDGLARRRVQGLRSKGYEEIGSDSHCSHFRTACIGCSEHGMSAEGIR